MNIEGYRKAKFKEPIIIDLDSGEEYTFKVCTREDVKVEQCLQFEQPNLEQNVVPAEALADRGKQAEERIEMVIQYDQSQNSYSYSYSCEMVQEEVQQQKKQIIVDKKPNNSQGVSDTVKIVLDAQQLRKVRTQQLKLKAAQKLAAKGKPR